MHKLKVHTDSRKASFWVQQHNLAKELGRHPCQIWAPNAWCQLVAILLHVQELAQWWKKDLHVKPPSSNSVLTLSQKIDFNFWVQIWMIYIYTYIYMSCPSWERQRTWCTRSPVQTLLGYPFHPMRLHAGGALPLWCDLGCCSQTVVVIRAAAKNSFYKVQLPRLLISFHTTAVKPEWNRGSCFWTLWSYWHFLLQNCA